MRKSKLKKYILSPKTLISIIAGSALIIVALVVAAFGMSGSNGAENTASLPSLPSMPSSQPVDSSEPDTSSDISSIVSSEAETSSVTSSKEVSSVDTSYNSNGKRKASYPPNDGDKVCYLTFDDGPSTKVTTRVLETLDEYNAKATFFVVGYGNLSLLDDIKDGGHAIGLHSDTHDWSIYKSEAAYFADLQALSDKVYEKVGVRSKIIRFPGGSSNTASKSRCAGIMSTLVESVEDKGYVYFDWNVDSTDASENKVSKEQIVRNVLKYAEGKDKICVLMHDLGVKTTTADALPEIIEGLKAMGYRFESLDENSPVFHQAVSN